MRGKITSAYLIMVALISLVTAGQCQDDFFIKALEAYRAGDYQQAGKLFQGHLISNSEDREAYRYYALTFYNQREYLKALEVSEQALEKFPADIGLWLIKGRLLEKLGRYQEAVATYDHLIKLDPRNAEVWKEKGNCRIKMGQAEEGLKDLEEARGLAPRDPWVYVALGVAKMRKGEYEAAKDEFNRGLKLDADFAPAYYYRGNLYRYYLKLNKLARSDYQQGCRLGHTLCCQELRHLDEKREGTQLPQRLERDQDQEPDLEGISVNGSSLFDQVNKQLPGKGQSSAGVQLFSKNDKNKTKPPPKFFFRVTEFLPTFVWELPHALIFLTCLCFICLVEGLILFLGSEERKQKKRLQKRLRYLQGLERSQVQESLIKAESFSNIPWLREFLKKTGRLEQLQTLLLQADVNLSLGRFLLLTLVSGGLGLSLGFYQRGDIGGVIGLLSGLVLPYQGLKFKRKMRFKRFEKQLPEALDLLARGLKAGHAFAAGLQLVAEEMPNPIGLEFFKTFKEYNHGLDLNTALGNMCKRVELQELRYFATAVMIQRETGGNLTELLEKIANLIRERFKLIQHIKGLTAEGRFSGLILILMAPLMFLGMMKLNREYAVLLMEHHLGRMMAMTAIVFQVLGVLVIRKIVNIKV